MNRAISWLFKIDWEFTPAYNVFWLSTCLLLLQLLLHPTTIPSKFLPNFMCSLYFFNPCSSLCVATVLMFNLIHWNLGFSLGVASLNKAYSPLPGSHLLSRVPQLRVGLCVPTFSAHSETFVWLALVHIVIALVRYYDRLLCCAQKHSSDVVLQCHSFSKCLWAPSSEISLSPRRR